MYNLFLFLYAIGIRISAIWSLKARKWLLGRVGIFEKIKNDINNSNGNIIWMHCASLGEFEQGRPLLEELKKNTTSKIVLTFFSPSGYEVMKNYRGVDHVFYLPMDNILYAKKFINLINPVLVLWVKYEYWYYYLQELKRRNIPVLLVSGIFRQSQPFFKWYGAIWRNMLQCFTHFFVQNDTSKKLLSSIGINKEVTVCGDTRFDRVIEIAKQKINLPLINEFCKNKNVIVAGSTWYDDEVILAAYGDETSHKEKFIIVPHEVDEVHIAAVKKMFKNSICWSQVENDGLKQNAINTYNTLIIDKIGMLSQLYSFGFINYVGGGFTNDGIHNILEAAVWGKPVVIGENFEKYFEAVDLVKSGAAEVVNDVIEFKEIIDYWVQNKDEYETDATNAKKYVYNNVGATEKIINYIQLKRFLTN